VPVQTTQAVTTVPVTTVPVQTTQAATTQPTITDSSTSNMRDYILSKIHDIENQGRSISGITNNGIVRQADGSYIIKPIRNTQAIKVGSRQENDVMKDESKYSYIDFNSMPQSANSGSFESGYSFLPPSQWYPVPPHPPVCVTEKQCPVCPIYTDGTNVELKEWNSSRRITPPDDINVSYIEDKLNSGR
jgi:hypothetical protein